MVSIVFMWLVPETLCGITGTYISDTALFLRRIRCIRALFSSLFRHVRQICITSGRTSLCRCTALYSVSTDFILEPIIKYSIVSHRIWIAPIVGATARQFLKIFYALYTSTHFMMFSSEHQSMRVTAVPCLVQKQMWPIIEHSSIMWQQMFWVRRLRNESHQADFTSHSCSGSFDESSTFANFTGQHVTPASNKFGLCILKGIPLKNRWAVWSSWNFILRFKAFAIAFFCLSLTCRDLCDYDTDVRIIFCFRYNWQPVHASSLASKGPLYSGRCSCHEVVRWLKLHGRQDTGRSVIVAVLSSMAWRTTDSKPSHALTGHHTNESCTMEHRWRMPFLKKKCNYMCIL